MALSAADFFIMDCEAHLNGGGLHDVAYFPGIKDWLSSVESLAKAWCGAEAPKMDWLAGWGPEMLLGAMDKAGIDVACVLREPDTIDGYRTISTNGYVAAAAEKYPDRFIFQSEVGPIVRRGVDRAIEELEYLVKERHAKLNKLYPVGDDVPINDRRLYPFYEKVCELGIVLTMHTGQAYIRPARTKFGLPIDLDDVCTDFPEMKVVAFHLGWPYHEQLFALASKHPNLYMSVSGPIAWFVSAPMKGAHLIGEAIHWAGVDKLIFGVDYWPGADCKACVDYMVNFTMPPELVSGYGYRDLTVEDKRKILGGTLAGLLGVEPRKRAGKAEVR